MADKSAFDGWVATHSTALLRSAILLTGDRHLGEELLRTALHRTYLHWESLTDAGAAQAYARRVMARLATRSWRPKWRGEVPTRDARDGLRRALAELPARQRAVVVLRYHDDHSEAETAELLGVGIGTVRSSTDKALAHLRGVVPPRVIDLTKLESRASQVPTDTTARSEPRQ